MYKCRKLDLEPVVGAYISLTKWRVRTFLYKSNESNDRHIIEKIGVTILIHISCKSNPLLLATAKVNPLLSNITLIFIFHHFQIFLQATIKHGIHGSKSRELQKEMHSIIQGDPWLKLETSVEN